MKLFSLAAWFSDLIVSSRTFDSPRCLSSLAAVGTTEDYKLSALEQQRKQMLAMHCKSGELEQARTLYESIVEKDLVSSTLLMGALGRQGFTGEANRLLHRTLAEGIKPDVFNLVTAMDSCCSSPRNLSTGRKLHSWILECVPELDSYSGTAVMRMFLRCKKVDSAKQVFQQIPQRQVFAWTLMITAYVESGSMDEAFQSFCQMQLEGVLPNSYTLVAVLQSCSTNEVRDERVRLLCDQVLETGMMDASSWNVIAATALIGTFGKCGELNKALEVFSRLPAGHRDAVAWNAIVTVCVEQGEGSLGLKLLREMRLEGVRFTRITFLKAIAAATEVGSFEAGRLLHVEALESLLDRDLVVGTALAGMYSRFGRINDAVAALEGIERQGRDLVCWNMIISALVQHSRSSQALSCFRQMNNEGIKPDRGTFASLLSGVFPENDLKTILDHVSETGLSCNLVVSNALLNMHAKSYRFVEARRVFDSIPEPDLISWNTMISSYATGGYGEEAIKLFHRMHQEGLRPDFVTLTSLFGAYSECRDLEEAYQVTLSTFEDPGMISSLLIAACAQQGLAKQALGIYRTMLLLGMRLENSSLVPVITSCAACSSFREARIIHEELARRVTSISEDCRLSNALIDTYGKCGKVELAHETFVVIRQPNLVSWTAMVSALAQNGHVEETKWMFGLMKLNGFSPDMVTFTSVLSMCSHAGLLEDGCRSFGSISGDFFLQPSPEHCSCVIDLLGRAGWLDEAESLVHSMPCKPNLFIWTALLSACRSHGDVERAQRVADNVVGLEPACSTGYIGLTNIISKSSHAHVLIID